jgi:hypothetical protein
MTDFVKTVQLPTISKKDLKVGDICSVAGWGLLNEVSRPFQKPTNEPIINPLPHTIFPNKLTTV